MPQLTSYIKKQFATLFAVFLLLITFHSYGQAKIDSLKVLLSQTKTDTGKVTVLNKIAKEYSQMDSGNLALTYAEQALLLAEKINNAQKIAESRYVIADELSAMNQYDSAIYSVKQALNYYQKQANSKALVKAYRLLADIYYENAQYPLANENYAKALTAATALKDSVDMRSIYYGQGLVYDVNDQFELARERCMRSIDLAIPLKQYRAAIGAYVIIGNDYAKQGISASAAKAYFEGLEINSKYLHDSNAMGILDIDIGNVYNDKLDSANAMKYYRESLAIFKQKKEERYIAQALENIGNVYLKNNDYKKAEVYELKCMEEMIKVGDKANTALCYSNVADFYNRTKQYDKSLDYYNKGLALQEEIGDKEGQIYSMSGLSDVYENLGDHAKAIELGVKSFNQANDIKLIGQVRDEAKKLSDMFDKVHQPEKAFYYYKQYITAKDSLENKEEAKKLINAELSHEYEQKQQMEKLENEKKQAIADENARHESIIRNIYLTAFIIVLFLTGLLFRNLTRIRKSNRIITEQKHEVERQKLIVDEKNKDITDSIKYASRIQRALLTTQEYIGKQVKEHFIFFKPRDIVSGDFYWAFKADASNNDLFYLACCDCTGHGVPGAFMSLLNISMLNESVIERKITMPDKVLNDIRDNIIKSLNPEKADTESKDGMDCVLSAFDLKNKRLHMACANNPVWIMRKAGEFVEINPDKMPVGIQYGDQKPFTLHTINLEEGDIIYMFTDGYADQFGGPKGKKFKYKQLQEIIIANAQKPMSEQKDILERTFVEWMGGLEQIDDMLVIGIKV
ncbi:MAG TPA: tetratricopeptide repeat protein [Bacteroidia bacterium]|nr:tetratricopeptide repeat protein [Bacteroidia bacterium]